MCVDCQQPDWTEEDCFVDEIEDLDRGPQCHYVTMDFHFDFQPGWQILRHEWRRGLRALAGQVSY